MVTHPHLWSMATFSVHAHEEDCSPEEMERAQGFAPGFAEGVRENMAKSAMWGWCAIEVRCTVKVGNNSYQGTDHLGGCSYISAEDFMAEGGYFEGMKQNAFEDLLSMLRAQVKAGRDAAHVLREG